MQKNEMICAGEKVNKANAAVRTYSWGPEAQGVPGTLRMIADSNGVYFPAYDPNGNVMGLVKASDGTVCAQYEYLPYGEQVTATGTMAGLNPIRFSTKYYDTEARLYYYGYRYYSPDMGRWLSRDPIEEQGGLNLYGFVNNDPVNHWDLRGKMQDERMYGMYRERNINNNRGWHISFQFQTDAVKENDFVRKEVNNMIHNFKCSRRKDCLHKNKIIKRNFQYTSVEVCANMYLTYYFYLGQVSVKLEGTGYYVVNCCQNKYEDWKVLIKGTFQDNFDELIPTGVLLGTKRKGILSLPLIFEGEWIEEHTGTGEERGKK